MFVALLSDQQYLKCGAVFLARWHSSSAHQVVQTSAVCGDHCLWQSGESLLWLFPRELQNHYEVNGFWTWSTNQGGQCFIHPRRSMLLDMEYASAERVDRTTLEIFLEDQLTGEMGASTLSLSWEVVVKMREPWNELSCLGLANDASPNETWVIFWGSMWLKHTLTSECICASRSTLLHSIRVEILGCDICAWTSPNLDAKSGRVWDTAYCKLPTSPRSSVFSISLTGLSGYSLRDFPMSIARILWIYSFWDAVMLKSGSCSNCIRVKISFLYFKLPKANVFQAPSAVMEVWVATPDSIIHVGAQNTVREVCVSHQHRIPE